MSERSNKYILLTLGFAGLTTLSYLAYKLLFKRNKSVEKELDEQALKLNRLKSGIKEKELKDKEEKVEKEKEIIEINYFSEILKKIVNHSFEQLYIFSDLLQQNFNKEGKFIGNEIGLDKNLNELQAEMIQKLQLENTRIIMSFGINPSNYNKTLTHYMEKNQFLYINYSVRRIDSLKLDFIKNQALSYSFPQSISENYLKIISNLFYITLGRCSLVMKQKVVDKENLEEGEKDYKSLIRNLYMSNLDSVRTRVCKFFAIDDDSLISGRTLLRVYTHSLEINHVIRAKYLKLNEYLDKIEDNMTKSIFPEVFVGEENLKEIDQVKDEVRDLESLITKVIDFQIIN